MLVSIITVCYNVSKSIIPTIESVLNNSNSDCEYIIVDGKSSDDTLEIIASYNSQFQEKNIAYKYISESDTGIYNAMNKGIALATGKYIIFTNVGDTLDFIPEEILSAELTNDCYAIAFPVFLPIENKSFKQEYNKNIIRYNTIQHQGIFYKKLDFLRYEEKYKILADFDLNQKIYKSNHSISIYDSPTVASHLNNGISSEKIAFKEMYQVIRQNFGIIPMLSSWFYHTKGNTIYKIKQFFS